MKRIFLFILTNFAVMAVLLTVTRIFGLGNYISAYGMNYTSLAVYSLVIGFVGSIISLLMSKSIAKWTSGAKVIKQAQTSEEAWLLDTVRTLSQKAGIGMPEVAIFEGSPNAFATGAFKNSALVAVSTGLMQTMTQQEIEAVLAHEVAHISNGDMVTMTLVQGVMNTFVVFISRAVGYVVDSFLSRDEESNGPGMGYYITTMIMDIFLGFLAAMIVAWFSRHREFRADSGAASIMGRKQPMIDALARLGGLETQSLPKNMASLGIAGGGIGKWFSSHPPIEARIAALQKNA